jgi:hypothetical protein
VLVKRPTTLILGAGTSAAYGFPLGAKLRDLVLGRSEEAFRFMLGNATNEWETWPNVQQNIAAFRPDSIDEYLARWGEHSSLVKMAIAYHLSKFESVPSLLSFENKDHWYDVLLKEVLGNDPALGDGLLRIITFNYDLSLEMYLYRVLQSRFRMSAEHAIRAIGKLGIVHVHGHLGPLKDLHDSGREYGPIQDPKNLQSVRKTISTCYEAEAKGDMTSARQAIAQSDAVLFLGFGYSDENLSHLQFKSSLPTRCRVVGSTYHCAGWEGRLFPQLHRPDEFVPVSGATTLSPTTELLRQLIEFSNDDARFAVS